MLGTLRVESNAPRGRTGRPARSSKMRLPGIAWWIIGVVLVALLILLSAELALGVARPDLDPGKTRSFMSADYQPWPGHSLPVIRLEIVGEVRHDLIAEEGDKAASAVLTPLEKIGSFLVTETPGAPPAPTSTPPPSNSPTAGPTHTPTFFPSSTATATATATYGPSPSPSSTPTSTATATRTPTATRTRTPAPTATGTPTIAVPGAPSPTATVPPAPTATNTATPTPTSPPPTCPTAVSGGGGSDINLCGYAFIVSPSAFSLTADLINNPGQPSFSWNPSWRTTDATGTGNGWHLNVRATHFTDGVGNTIPVAYLTLILPNGNIVIVAGNQKPASQMTTQTPLSTLDQMLALAAPGTGMGSYDMTGSFTLSVPPGTPPGFYSSAVNLTILAGP